jgi:hypothetical protein
MKAITKIVLSSLLLSAPVSNAQAQSCLSMPKYVDHITINNCGGILCANDYALYGINKSKGYAMFLTGGFSPAPASPVGGYYGLQGVAPLYFGGHPNCVFYFHVTGAPPPSWDLHVTCVGGSNGVWKKSATVEEVAHCAFTKPAAGLKALGEAPSD